MNAADGIVLPKPQVPKTLGILNIIFGVLLILVGSCSAITIIAAPVFQQYSDQLQGQMKKQAEAQRQAQVKSLDDREKAATTDEEKASIQAERDALTAAPIATPPVADMQALDQFKDPIIRGFSIAQLGTGLLWDVALIVSGIGLVRLREWGRKLAYWLSAIQIVRLLVLVAISFAVVAPVQQKHTDRMIAKMEARVKAGNPNPTDITTIQTTKLTAQFAPLMTLAYGILGCIYPALCLWLLNTPGARAATAPRKSDEWSDLPGGP